MPIPPPDDANSADADSPNAHAFPPNPDEILRWLEQLRRSDRALYNLMAIEIWAIAQTMDAFIPSFWSRFMENRQLAMHEFLALRHAQQVNFSKAVPDVPHPEAKPDGIMEGDSAE